MTVSRHFAVPYRFGSLLELSLLSLLFIPNLALAQSFSQDLSLGSSGSEVMFLQELLRQQSDIYPEGVVNGSFDNLTKAALERFQSTVGISDPAILGTVEATTRTFLNSAVDDSTREEFNAEIFAEEQSYSSARTAQTARSMQSALESRNASMKRLFITNPSKAWEFRLTKKERNKFPREHRSLIEEDAKVKGTVGIRYEDRFDIGYSVLHRELFARRRPTYGLMGNDSRLKAGDTVQIKGLKLGTAVIPDPSVSGVRVTRAALGDPDAALARLHANQNIVAILLRFSDRPAPVHTPAEIANNLVTLKNYFEENSYGKTQINIDVKGWYTVSKPASQFPCNDYWEYIYEAVHRADPFVDFRNYHTIFVVAAEGADCGVGGGGVGPWDITTNDGVIALGTGGAYEHNLPWTGLHEVGHAFGLSHSNRLDCSADSIRADPLGAGGCNNRNAGNRLDVMGQGGRGHLTAIHKRALGITSATGLHKSLKIDAPGTYTVDVYETPAAGIKSLRLPRIGNKSIFIEYRRKIGFDTNASPYDYLIDEPLLDVALINLDLVELAAPVLIDATPQMRAELDEFFNAFDLNKTFYDPETQWAITPVSNTATQLTVNVEKFPPLNCSPATQIVAAGAPVHFSAQGGVSQYVWTAPAGTVTSGSGVNFTTAFSNGGSYTVNVGLSGRSVTAQCKVTVQPGSHEPLFVEMNLFGYNGDGSNNDRPPVASDHWKSYTVPPAQPDVTVNWSSSGAGACVLKRFVGSNLVSQENVQLTGSRVFPLPTAATRYEVSCDRIVDYRSDFKIAFLHLASAPTPRTPAGNNSICHSMRVFPAVSLWDSPYLHPIEIDIVNNGGKTWKVDETPHRLVIEPGTLLWDFSDVASPIGLRSFVPLPREVKPGELVTFKFVARWHDYGGPNTFNVKMTEEGVETFGESCRTMVDVFDEGDTP